MKRNQLLIIIVAIQLFFVFFYIFKESQIIKLSYQKQKLEQQKKELIEEKKRSLHILHLLKNKSALKEAAQQKGMEKLKLRAIRQ